MRESKCYFLDSEWEAAWITDVKKKQEQMRRREEEIKEQAIGIFQEGKQLGIKKVKKKTMNTGGEEGTPSILGGQENV